MKTQTHGIALKDRTPDQVRQALHCQPSGITREFIRLHEYAVAERLGITPLAHQTGISSTVLSQAFNGSYTGDYVAISLRIAQFRWRRDQQKEFGSLRDFKETALASTLWSIFDKTRIIRRLQIIQGPEQVGKSRSASEYAQRENNVGRTLYITLPGGTRNGCGDFIWAIADALDIPYTAKLREKRLRIKHALVAYDLIIIDQAHQMWSWNNNGLRDFWDYIITDIFADGARGIVFLSTNNQLLEGLQAWRLRARYNIGQLMGRMRNDPINIEPEIDIILEDVALLARRYYDIGTDTLTQLHQAALLPGHFGLIEDILNESWTRAKANKRKLSDTIVKAVQKEILTTLKSRESMYK